MVSRRSFLAITGAAAAGLATGCHAGAASTASAAAASPSAGGPVRADRIGVQLYTVRDQMEKDFTGTLEQVAQIGFKEVEFAGYFNHSAADVKSLLDRLGLTAPSSHIGLDVLQKDLAGQIQIAHTIGHEFITVPALMEAFAGKTIDADFWQRTAAEFNRIAKALQAEGVGFAYHNHSFEFVPLGDGRTGYDILLTQTDPSLVKFELDLLWATFAGQDPVEMFKRSPGRFPMWHVKDIHGVADARRAAAASGGNVIQQMGAAMSRLAAVGTGDIDFRRIFAQASTAGLKHFFVENDAAPNTPSSLGDIRTSYDNLKRMLA
jgi:sugar phosphate isomerase/epimerase